MEYQKICYNCGCSFISIRFNAKYCNYKCKNHINSITYRTKNKLRIKLRKQKEYQLHKDAYNRRQNKSRKILQVRLAKNLRNRIWHCLRNGLKSVKSLDLLGCSVEQLKQHLEKQFTKGMNWNNYGYKGWHVDHIKPCCNFDLSKVSEQRKCFNYSNLQPLWAKQNFRKNKYFKSMVINSMEALNV